MSLDSVSLSQSFRAVRRNADTFVYDHIGNVVAVVDDTDAIIAAYEYDPFGNIVTQVGPEADEVPFRFSTKYFDFETGLYYYGYRFYAPQLGRWPNRDPIEEEGGENLYAFCKNNAILCHDCFGLIDVKVTSLHENSFWEGIFRNAEKYQMIEVRRPSDIIIYRGNSRSLYGGFTPSSPHSDHCGTTVYIGTSIFLNQEILRQPTVGVVYTFSPHTIENESLIDNPSYTSDHSPFLELPVLLHEYAHAHIFLTEVVPLYKSKR